MQLLQLLLLCFCFLLVEGLRFDDWKDRVDNFRDSLRDRFKHRFGNMSEELKQRLSKEIGSLDARKARLEKFLKKPHRNLTQEQKDKIKERLAKLIPIKTEKPDEKEPTDLFEVNLAEGVADYMYQGDIDLTDEQANALDASSDAARTKRQASSVYTKWADNTVYFYFDASISKFFIHTVRRRFLDERKKASVAAAHQFMQSRTCVNFVESSTATNRIRVFSGSGCFSKIGMVGREQTLSLGDGCESMKTAAHEFMHALGIWHMQMRNDRDEYVTIDMTYVPQEKQFNFDKLAASKTIDNLTPYEYGSAMHYSSRSFTNPSDKLSIIPKDMDYAYSLSNNRPSFYDIMLINKFYDCDDHCSAATSAKCKNGGVPNPRNCAVCNCPFGYEGDFCDQRPAGCGETWAATSSWQSKSFSYGDKTSSQGSRDNFDYCNYWITAPANQKIELQITSMFNTQCGNGCPFNGIEIKTDSDIRVSNPRYCCPEFVNKTIASSLNPTPLIAYNRYYYTSFTIKYRAVPTNPTDPGNPIITTPHAPTTTTVKTMTTHRPTPGNCRSMQTPELCANNKRYGFCDTPLHSFQVIKYNCAEECGLCGKAASPCVDVADNCYRLAALGYCVDNLSMMRAEYLCAKTCGFCENPL